MSFSISSINGTSTQFGDPFISNQKTKELGKDDFLELLITQLRYQDPLNPLDGVEFTAQLAQFASLEQLFNMNDALESINSSQSSDRKIESIGLIGKEIEAQGDLIELKENQSAKGSFILDEPAICEVYIYSTDGRIIRRIDLGQLGTGRHSFQWDGRDNSGELVEAGTYTFNVSAENQEGELIQVETRISGTVTGVSFENDEPVIYVGDIGIDLSQILEVKIEANNNF
jgi:flagellar basal-body rod modification protein FlgD